MNEKLIAKMKTLDLSEVSPVILNSINENLLNKPCNFNFCNSSPEFGLTQRTVQICLCANALVDESGEIHTDSGNGQL